MVRLGTELQRRLEQQFSDVHIILFGSGITGMSIIKKMFGLSAQDLDWAVTSQRPLTQNDYEEITKVGNELIKELVTDQSTQFSDTFKSCDFFNPTKFHIQSLNSSRQAQSIVNSGRYGHLDFLLFFLPSFPAQVNQKNQAHVLEALRNIAKTDISLWAKITHKMIGQVQLHSFQTKHLQAIKDHAIGQSTNQPDNRRHQRITNLKSRVQHTIPPTLRASVIRKILGTGL